MATKPSDPIEPVPTSAVVETQPDPVITVEPVPTPVIKSVLEPEIINDFYKSLDIPYCKKCGERSRTSDGITTFCPIAKPNCSGFSAEPSPISE